MHSTRRRPEPNSAGARGFSWRIFPLIASGTWFAALAASCATESNDSKGADASIETTMDATPDTTPSSDAADGGADANDAALVDAAPLAVECTTHPCAVALTTTLSGPWTAREEGYCALLDDGTVVCWGGNGTAQLGNGIVGGLESAVPSRVPGLSNVVAIDHTCAVDKDGAVWCWGSGPFLQSDASATTVEPSPVHVSLPGPADKVAVTSDAACALLRDGSVVCWGSNADFRIALDEPSEAALFPRAATLPTGVKNIAIGQAAFAVYEDGHVLSWGAVPAVGRLTPIAPDGWPSPIQLDHVAMIDTIEVEACAAANGVGWCWGSADGNAAFARAVPIATDVPELVTRMGVTRTLYTVTPGLPMSIERHRWCAATVTGNVYCHGLNNSGQAGDGTKDFALGAVRVAGLPERAAEVKTMPHSTCAMTTNGKLYCWGNNLYGQLGAGLPKGSVLAPAEVRIP